MGSTEDGKANREVCLINLSESVVLRLPISGPISRRIYAISQTEDSQEEKELFVQRNDAFATNLFGLLRSLKAMEILEIRYSVGFDGVIRIFLDQKGELEGEFFCKSKESSREFKRKMQIT